MSAEAGSETRLVDAAAGRDYKAMDGDIGDSSADETNNLVLSESHPLPSSRKKYVVSQTDPKKKCLSRNEWICVAVGAVAVVMGLTVVLGIGVGAGVGRSGSSSSSSSSEGPWKNVRLPSYISPEGWYKSLLSFSLPVFLVSCVRSIGKLGLKLCSC